MHTADRQTDSALAQPVNRSQAAVVRQIFEDSVRKLSVVVPVRDEAANIAPLLAEFAQLAQRIPVGEVIYVDDGSTDGSYEILCGLRDSYPFLRVLRHDHSVGQSAATWTGVSAARNSLVVTIDGDGQNDPADIALLYDRYGELDSGPEPVMVMGQRLKRRDNLVRKLSSRVANTVRSAALHDATRDTGCSLKMFQRSDYLCLPYFDHMHRFLPALMNRQGVIVGHVDVAHRPRLRGVSKYGTWDRLWAGIADLVGVMWLQRRGLEDIDVSEVK